MTPIITSITTLFWLLVVVRSSSNGTPLAGDGSEDSSVGLDIRIEVFIGNSTKPAEGKATASVQETAGEVYYPPPVIILPEEVSVTSQEDTTVVVNCSVLYADFISWTLSSFFENSTAAEEPSDSNRREEKIYGFSRQVVTEPLVINDCVRCSVAYGNVTHPRVIF